MWIDLKVNLKARVASLKQDRIVAANADFDDLNGSTPDDEDGVTFGTIQVGALQQMVTVNVQGTAGKLDAWI